MADDILDSFLDEDFDGDLPIVIGGQRRLMQGGQIVVPPKSSLPLNVGASSTAPTQKSKSVTGDLDLAGQYADDQDELLSAQANEVRTLDETTKNSEADQKMHDLTEAAELACGREFSDNSDVRRRFHLVVEAFFKDLRDQLETKSKLTMPVASGGLGLTDDQAERVIVTLLSKRGEFNASMLERTQVDRQKFVSAAADKQLHGQERLDENDRADLDRRYQKKYGEASADGESVVTKPEIITPPKIIKVIGQGKHATPAPVMTPAVSPVTTPKVKDDELADALKIFLSKDESVKPTDSTSGDLVNIPAMKDNKPTADPSNNIQQSITDENNSYVKPVPPPVNLPVVDQASVSVSAPTVVSQPKPEIKLETYSAPTIRPAVPAPTPPIAVPTKPRPAPPKPPLLPHERAALAEKQSTEPSLQSILPPSSTAPPKSTAVPVAVNRTVAKPFVPTTVSSVISAANKPVVSDVKSPAAKLLGPVEELRSLTLKDFRRLSKDPKEATLKIRDKIDLLGDEQSFEVKTAGIVAWRDSAINKLYLEILRRSLEGKPLNEVMTTMESAGEDTLTKVEFDAIMKLNRDIRFG
ncbi:MAG: hypothetical protein V1738_06180 [Patescibacteria group bacterium]